MKLFLTAIFFMWTSNVLSCEFRGLKLGEELNIDDTFIVLENKGTQIIYSRKSDEMKIGNASLDQIKYIVDNNNKLIRIVVQSDTTQTANLKSAADKKFGNPTKIERKHWIEVEWATQDCFVSLTELTELSLSALSIEDAKQRTKVEGF